MPLYSIKIGTSNAAYRIIYIHIMYNMCACQVLIHTVTFDTTNFLTDSFYSTIEIGFKLKSRLQTSGTLKMRSRESNH